MVLKLDAAIAQRLAIVCEDLDSLKARAAYVKENPVVGGDHSVFSRLAFYEERKKLLEWMVTASAVAIELKRGELQAELEKRGAERFKYGTVIGLPGDLVLLIAKVELLEYGLGLHPSQMRSARVHKA